MSDANLPKILITIPFEDAGLEILQEIAQVDIHKGMSPKKLESMIGEYHALIVSSEFLVPDRTIEYAYQLQVIGVAGASLDHLNVSAARAQGVSVVNVPNPRSLALAEQIFGSLLMLAHRHQAVGLSGKTLGIIGFGPVGHEVARRAKAFGMHVVVNQPRLTPELALEVGVELCDFQSLLESSDIISLHVPSTPNIRNLIGAEELALTPPGCILINVSNPEAVDYHALNLAIEKGQIAGAAVIADPDKKKNYPNLSWVDIQAPGKVQVDQDIAIDLAKKIVNQMQKRRPGNPLSLHVVPVERVLPHEHYDPERVSDLAARLEIAETLVNPPVVVESEGYYIVLDGATRTTAFKQLEYPHIVVQAVSAEDEHLLLHTWYHALCGPAPEDLLSHLQNRKSYEIVPASDYSLANGAIYPRVICSLHFLDEQNFVIQNAENVDRLTALNEFVSDYTEIARIERTLNTDKSELANEVDDLSALVIFPQFSIKDVLLAALNGQLLPAGITRFVIPGRVLRLHADMEYLRSGESLTRKNAWLDRLLADKMTRRRVRYYQEPVFLLDE
ncbi:MAG: hypothetical protein ISR58_12760 [Anaerolineales bacterium]|nr:hypothetical protein [Chloroflexota bacterium]MBL6982050.1 hypothetical protein [Anaerolineales bacterium]